MHVRGVLSSNIGPPHSLKSKTGLSEFSFLNLSLGHSYINIGILVMASDKLRFSLATRPSVLSHAKAGCFFILGYITRFTSDIMMGESYRTQAFQLPESQLSLPNYTQNFPSFLLPIYSPPSRAKNNFATLLLPLQSYYYHYYYPYKYHYY